MWKALVTRTDASADPVETPTPAARSSARRTSAKAVSDPAVAIIARPTHPSEAPVTAAIALPRYGAASTASVPEHEGDHAADRDPPAAPPRAGGARASIGAGTRRGRGDGVLEGPRVLEDCSGHPARVDRVRVCRLWKACQGHSVSYPIGRTVPPAVAQTSLRRFGCRTSTAHDPATARPEVGAAAEPDDGVIGAA
jgi:hypothetical protein